MTDGNSHNNNDYASGESAQALQLSFAAVVGEDNQVLLKARSPHGETALPLSGEQAARLGRALLTASVALGAGAGRPPAGTAVDDCQFPVLRWTAARSNRNGLPLVVATLPGGVSLTLQLDDQTLVQCAESLMKLSQTPSASESGQGEMPPVI